MNEIPIPNFRDNDPRIRFTLAIIGGGPNCLYVIERLYAHVRGLALQQTSIAVDIFDATGSFGSGCHYRSQPSTNHLNRAADQISFGADESNLDEVSFLLDKAERWTLYDWCRNRFEITRDERYDVDPREWVERKLFGEVSEQVFATYVERLRLWGISVTLNVATVEDIEEVRPDRYAIRSRDSQGRHMAQADFVVLCTGHGETTTQDGSLERMLEAHAEQHSGTGYIHHIYPIERITTDSIPAGCSVACRGMGLAAIDFLLRVTEGRGGRFIRKADNEIELEYVSNGAEPKKIFPFSESGIFLYTRAYNQKMNDPSLYHKGIFFTKPNIDRLRSTVGTPMFVPCVGLVRQLDFDAHVVPIMRLEMALLYYKTLFGPETAARMIEISGTRVRRFIGQVGSWHSGPAAAIEFLTGAIDVQAIRTANAIAAVLEGRCPEMRPGPELRNSVTHFLAVLFGRRYENLPHELDELAAFEDHAKALWAQSPRWAHDRDPRRHIFDWNSVIDPLHEDAVGDGETQRITALELLRKDIHSAMQGNIDNPLKASIDGVWRDLRGTIRYVIEFGGLTARSHARFNGTWSRITNRIAVGTSLKIMLKIFALAESGRLDLSLARGPDVKPRQCGGYTIAGRRPGSRASVTSVFVNARVHRFHLARMRNPLYTNLQRRGLIREWINPGDGGEDFGTGGVDVQQGTNLVVRGDGAISRTMAVLGPPTEGPLYFHLAAMRPYCGDPVIADADRVVCKFLERVAH
jgi:FAD-NAD(P)-binding